jgi:hypothetical protein
MQRITQDHHRIPDDAVMFWWNRGEFAEQREEWQFSADYEQAGSDLLLDDAAVASMQAAPLGEPPSDFDVRCVYDSRPVNGYDFNYSAQVSIASGVAWSTAFNVPNGYRIVPRKWQVQFDSLPLGPLAGNFVSLQQNGANVPNNGPIIVGMGTDEPIESFFLCEENTTFGISGVANQNTNANINVYGNLIPVTDVALPLSVSNQKKLIGVN